MSSPLRRVLVTRSPHQGSELAERLRAMGLEPILIPAIEIVEPGSFAILDAALAKLEGFQWLVFTSANAVAAFAHRLEIAQLRVLHPCDGTPAARWGEAPQPCGEAPQVAAIGAGTARALEAIRLTPDVVPLQAVAESLGEALLRYARQPDGRPTRFLLIRAEEGREHLPETLRAAGAEVTVAPAYRTVIPAGSMVLLRELFAPSAGGVPRREAGQNRVGAITFTSSSTARNLVALCEAAGVGLPASAMRVSIGPITSQTLRELGLPPHAEASEATLAALAEAVMRSIAKE